MPNPERSSKRKAKELASASSNFKEQKTVIIWIQAVAYTVNEKKTNDDEELVVETRPIGK